MKDDKFTASWGVNRSDDGNQKFRSCSSTIDWRLQQNDQHCSRKISEADQKDHFCDHLL